MVDIRIRKNEHCVIGLPACDYVFSSTRSCFIAYGFSTSGLERDVLSGILKERGIEAVEAGGELAPGKFTFCTKICSKIIVSQFCIVLANNDKKSKSETPNSNVHIEYGLMLGHNKYIIPFQRDDQKLPFNVAGLDTIKYNQNNFKELSIRAIEQAIKQTTQNQPLQSIDQIIAIFVLIKNAIFVNVQNNLEERLIFELGKSFGFNFLVQFDGLSYVFLGNFSALQGNAIIWRLNKLLELLDSRVKSVAVRVAAGFTTEKAVEIVNFFIERLQIWLVVAGEKEKGDIASWLGGRKMPLPLEIFTITEVANIVSHLPDLPISN